MEHFNEFIDYDEGRQDPREPFFTEAIPCESCGSPCDETRQAPWDTKLNVGPCCYINASIPDVPVCQGMLDVIDSCPLTSSVAAAMEAHRECCETCRVEVARKGIVGEVGDRRRERAA
jgi:hypothetical protein